MAVTTKQNAKLDMTDEIPIFEYHDWFAEMDLAQAARDMLDGKGGDIVCSANVNKDNPWMRVVHGGRHHVDRENAAARALEAMRNVYVEAHPKLTEEFDEIRSKRMSSSVWSNNRTIAEARKLYKSDRRMFEVMPTVATAFLLSHEKAYNCVTPTCYAIASSRESLAVGIMAECRAMPKHDSREFIVIHPDFANNTRMRKHMDMLADNADCLFDERVTNIKTNSVEAREMLSRASSRLSGVTVATAYRDMLMARYPNVGCWIDKSERLFDTGLVFPEGTGKVQKATMEKIRRQMKHFPTMTVPDLNYLKKMTAALTSFNDLPEMMQFLLTRITLLFPLYIHMEECLGKKFVKKNYADFETLWREGCGRQYFEAIAAGVPIEDVVA